MPYVPRQALNSTSGVRPELTTIPRAARRANKPPVPYLGSSPGEQTFELNQKKNPGIGRMSIKDHTMDPMRVIELLFGRNGVQVDEFSGELVLAGGRTS